MLPITPQEAIKARFKYIPEFVIEAFNACIIEKLEISETTLSAKVKQKDVVAKILLHRYQEKEITREQIFENHWLDIEEYFESAGWKVRYDKPLWNETYDAFFLFKVER